MHLLMSRGVLAVGADRIQSREHNTPHTYRITRKHARYHPPSGTIFRDDFPPQKMGAYTTKMVDLEISCRDLSIATSLGVCTLLVVDETNPKIVRGGVLPRVLYGTSQHSTTGLPGTGIIFPT